MPFIVCSECGEQAELSADALSALRASDDHFYCRKCENPIPIPQAESVTSPEKALLDELLNLEIAPPRALAPSLSDELSWDVPAVAARPAADAAPTTDASPAAPADASPAAPADAAPAAPADAAPADASAPVAEAAPSPADPPIPASARRSPGPPPVPPEQPSDEEDSAEFALPNPSASTVSASAISVIEPVAVEAVPFAAATASDAPPSDTLPSAYSVDPSLRATTEERSTLPFGPWLSPETKQPKLTVQDDAGAASTALPLVTGTIPSPRSDNTEELADVRRTEPLSPALQRLADRGASVSPAASDAPVVNSWLPPPPPSNLRRFAPLAAALGAVALAFFVGIKVGRVTAPATEAATQPSVGALEATRRAARPSAVTGRERDALAATGKGSSPSLNAPNADSHPSTNTDTSPLAADSPAPGELAPAGAVAAAAKGRRFSPKTAYAALTAASARVRACKKPGTGATSALATVTFGPSGRVEDVTVAGAKIAGTPTASCIASALNSARVPAFGGNAQTIKRTFKL